MAPSIEQIARGDAAPPPHLVEALGALSLWAMAEPGRTLHVSETVGRPEFNRAIKVTITEPGHRPRSWQVDVAKPLAEGAGLFLMELVTP